MGRAYMGSSYKQRQLQPRPRTLQQFQPSHGSNSKQTTQPIVAALVHFQICSIRPNKQTAAAFTSSHAADKLPNFSSKQGRKQGANSYT
ncbi:hypothetical protein ACLOJK_022735 [Asimina triloba]